jgi:hypothetical protein
MSVVSLNSNDMMDFGLSSGNERDNLKKILFALLLFLLFFDHNVLFCFEVNLLF